jgi:hypothetical protein
MCDDADGNLKYADSNNASINYPEAIAIHYIGE